MVVLRQVDSFGVQLTLEGIDGPFQKTKACSQVAGISKPIQGDFLIILLGENRL